MTVTLWEPTIGSIVPPLPVSQGGTGAITAAAASAALGQMSVVASTGVTGYTLVNGTGTILTWTAPNDGALHRVVLITGQHVTVAETGGQISLNTTLPDGTAVNPTVFAGGSGTGGSGFTTSRNIQANSTVTLTQSSALTVGAAVLWAEIWAL